MLAGPDYRVIYGNKALMVLMARHESEIRSAVPRFSAAELMGASIDLFHESPSQLRSIAGPAQGSHAARVKMGSRVFDLGFSHVLDAKGSAQGPSSSGRTGPTSLSLKRPPPQWQPRTRACARRWTPARPT